MDRSLIFEVIVDDETYDDEDKMEQIHNQIVDGVRHALSVEHIDTKEHDEG